MYSSNETAAQDFGQTSAIDTLLMSTNIRIDSVFTELKFGFERQVTGK